MDVILIPGFWLDASSWDPVIPLLEGAGYRTHALTLPGMESRDADRSGITLRDHVDAVVDVIDALDPADGRVVLVGHSAGGAIAHAAVDARPDRVARVVYVDSIPLGDGGVINAELPAEDGEIPLPDWSAFGDEDLIGLDDRLRAAFRERAIPTPARVAADPQRLSDLRRYDVPITVIACQFTADMYREFMDPGHDWYPYVDELAKITDVDFVDLPTGHWPQFTRPDDLARVILAALDPEEARPEPPQDGDEAATLLGFLDYQRATLAWKCSGLQPAGLQATVGVSSITLGGLLKHLAWVEDYWFSHRLHGSDPQAPWDSVDWKADPDWEWHSAAGDTPKELFDLWRASVARSRSRIAESLADGTLDRLAARPWPDGSAPSLRWILVHMIEEYARHNGHADLIRESVDGATGE